MTGVPRILRTKTLTLLSQLNVELSRDSAAALGYAREVRSRFDFERDDIEELIAAYKAATRVFFSQADAMVYLMRQAIGESIDDPRLRMKPADKAWFLRSPDKARFLRAARLVLTYFPRLWDSELSYSKETEGYRAFRQLAVCRGRFTHPNVPHHLLPVELLLLLPPGMQWFLFAYTSLVVQQAKFAGVRVASPTEGRKLAEARDETFRRAEENTSELIAARFPLAEAARIEIFLEVLMHDTVRALELVPTTSRNVGWAKARWAVVSLVEALVTEVEGAAHICGGSLAARGLLREGGTRGLLQGDAVDYREGVVDIADLFSGSFGRGERLSRVGEGWNAFLELKVLRDRIAHPRGLDDIEIAPASLGLILEAAEWIREQLLPQFMPVRERM